MSLIVTVMIAECLRTDCSGLGDTIKKNEAVGRRSVRKVRNEWLANVKMDLGDML
jgi:hypothetical protein